MFECVLWHQGDSNEASEDKKFPRGTFPESFLSWLFKWWVWKIVIAKAVIRFCGLGNKVIVVYTGLGISLLQLNK